MAVKNEARRKLVHLSLSQDRPKAFSVPGQAESEPVWLLSNWVYACVPNRVPKSYFLPIQRSKQRRITCNKYPIRITCNEYPICRITCNEYPICRITCNEYPICRITCNTIPNLSYYLQYNPQSVVLPAIQSPICRITCNAILLSYLSPTADLQCAENVRSRSFV